MKRREFLGVLSGAVAAWPLAARAQQPAMPVVGFLNSESPELYAHLAEAFRQGLGEAGFVEGRNVAVEYHWAYSKYDRLPALVADLVRRKVSVIAVNSPPILAAKAATATIPIVFFTGFDPVRMGVVESLSRPGGNITGVTVLNVELAAKRLDLIHKMVPKAGVIAVLVNQTNANADLLAKDLQAAAGVLGVSIRVVKASTEPELDAAFASLARLGAGALIVGADGFFNSRSKYMAALTVRHRVPAIFQYHEFVAAGGLLSYGGSISDAFRQVGVYTGRVLKGEKPADLPVQQVTKVRLIINLNAAKALGLVVPISLLGRADEVIE